MNYNNLTSEEILRVAVPSTDLEIRLFSMVSDFDEENASLRQQVNDYEITEGEEIDSLGYRIDTLEEKISDAINICDENQDNEIANKIRERLE